MSDDSPRAFCVADLFGSERWVVHLEPLGGINFWVEDEWNARHIVEFVNERLTS